VSQNRTALFRGRHFEGVIIILCVRWYLRYSLSYRDLEEMMAERGLLVDHVTIWRWVQHYAPILNQRLRREVRHPNGSWRVDETYVRVGGEWAYLYPAVDSAGDTIDFLLSPKRDLTAAKLFLRLALSGTSGVRPRVISARGTNAFCRQRLEKFVPRQIGKLLLAIPEGVDRGRPIPQSLGCASRSARYGVVMLFPHPIQFGPFLRVDLPLALITHECELLLLLTHQDPRSRRLPPFTERCDGMAAIDRIDADVFDLADDHPSILRIILCSGGTNIGTRNTPLGEIPAHLRRIEIPNVVDVRALFCICPFQQEQADLPIRISRELVCGRVRELHRRRCFGGLYR
jgi:transposase-like protein